MLAANSCEINVIIHLVVLDTAKPLKFPVALPALNRGRGYDAITGRRYNPAELYKIRKQLPFVAYIPSFEFVKFLHALEASKHC